MFKLKPGFFVLIVMFLGCSKKLPADLSDLATVAASGGEIIDAAETGATIRYSAPLDSDGRVETLDRFGTFARALEKKGWVRGEEKSGVDNSSDWRNACFTRGGKKISLNASFSKHESTGAQVLILLTMFCS